MDFYKILNENECHYYMQYKTGLNIDIKEFFPYGNCEGGGMYFSREDILAFLEWGVWIRKVTIPNDAQVYENPGEPKKWKTDRFILGERERINLDVIKRLHQEGADINVENYFPLQFASEYGHLDIVEYLVEHGSDIHTREDYPLRYSAKNGHLNVVEYLVEHGSDIHARGDYALWCASKNGNLDIVQYLIQHGADQSAIHNCTPTLYK